MVSFYQVCSISYPADVTSVERIGNCGVRAKAHNSQVKDFLKFLVIIAILYCGFFVTFWSLGREAYTTSEMGWFLVRIFFGSSYIGFDSMNKFGVFGPTLMYGPCFHLKLTTP